MNEQETTFDADTGTPVTETARPVKLVSPVGTVPSIINIPPQIAVTVFWIAVGFGLCYWLTNKKG